ncbi:unnamed protein product [Durusdinium trenchii]|uniref:Uncharacterized protein n=1 Tax=Durusdinium trenchii TaxID=1381693 RepID=A0ABP0MUB5_9DINO
MAQTMASFHAGRRNNAWLPSAAVLGAACVACLHAPSAFVGQRPPLRVSNPPTVRFAGDNLFERFARVAKANVNKVLQGMEDPEKVLDQALDEMQGDLIKVRQSYAEVLATQRRLVNQKEQSDKLAEDWYRRAEMAVEKGDDELAKEALSRRQSSVQKATGLQDQIDAMTGNVEKLFESVKALEEKITQAKEEKEQLIARARTAKTTSQVNEMLSDVTSTGASGAFDRMKEKVEMLETRAEVEAPKYNLSLNERLTGFASRSSVIRKLGGPLQAVGSRQRGRRRTSQAEGQEGFACRRCWQRQFQRSFQRHRQRVGSDAEKVEGGCKLS